MKKNILTILVLIVTIISLTVVFVACNDKDEPVVVISDELVDTTFYTLASKINSDKMAIIISSKDDDYTIYERTSDGKETVNAGIQIDTTEIADATATLEYKAEAFSSTRIVDADKSATLIAEVKTPKDFLGITDSDVTISTATVVIQISKSTSGETTTYALKEITVDYEMTVQGIAFVVESTIKA